MNEFLVILNFENNLQKCLFLNVQIVLKLFVFNVSNIITILQYTL